MKNILVAVDDTKGSVKIIDAMTGVFCACKPESVILLHVQKMEGDSVMDELLLSDSEMGTLKESLQGTEHQQMLNKKSERVLSFFTDEFTKNGLTGITPIIKEGHPAEEILKTAQEKNVEMIVMGSRGKRLHNLFMGSVSREVSNKAEVSVLLIK